MITTDTLLDRSIFLMVGCGIGLIFGWTARTMHYARQARDDAHLARMRVEHLTDDVGEQQQQQQQPGPGSSSETGAISASFSGVALLLVVLLTASAATLAGVNQNRVTGLLHDAEKERACTSSVIGAIIDTLGERSTLTSDISQADKAQNKAFEKIVGLSITGPTSRKQSLRVLKDYQTKLTRYLDLIEEAQAKRNNNPYPEREDYSECLDQKD